MKQVKSNNRLFTVMTMLVAGFVLATILLSKPVLAHTIGLAQPLDPTPTPNADGVIIVIVQVGDTLWSVAARAGLTLDELLELNDLTRDSFIQPGQPLIIGYAEGSAPPSGPGGGSATTVTVTVTAAANPSQTVTPQPTATPPATATPQPTPEPVAVSETGGSICLKAFDDTNRNGLHDAGEPLRPAVAFTITNADTQSVTTNYITDATTDSYCVTGLASGSYLITRSKAENEAMTTPDNWAVAMVDGATMNLVFGSYLDLSSPTPVAAAVSDTEDTNAAATSLTEDDPAAEEGSNGIITGIVIAVVALAILLLVGVLAVILSARRSTV